MNGWRIGSMQSSTVKTSSALLPCFADNTLGDIVYLETFGKGILILDSMEAVVDLLERRGSIYSSRPQVVMSELYVSASVVV
jgi:hypothetical protein